MTPDVNPATHEELVHVFVSYAREDKRWLDPEYRFNLIPFLSESLRRHNVVFWFDAELKPGDEYKRNIDSEIDQAQIAILVVSQHFLNSEFIESREMPRIAGRAQQGKMVVIPVLVEPCDWSDYPFLSDRQMVPSSPLIEYTVSDPSWAKVKYQILDGLKAQLKRIREPQPAAEVRKPEPVAKSEPVPAVPVQPVAAAPYQPPVAAQYQPTAGAQGQAAGPQVQQAAAAQYRPPAAGQSQQPAGTPYQQPAGAQYQQPGAAQYRPPAGPASTVPPAYDASKIPPVGSTPVYGAPQPGQWPQYVVAAPPPSSPKVPHWVIGVGISAVVVFGLYGAYYYSQHHPPAISSSTEQQGGSNPDTSNNGMQSYTSDAGKFSILFPGSPQQQTHPVNLPGGKTSPSIRSTYRRTTTTLPTR